ncbi:hypothetical protein [Paenibacillus sp. SN-8-1]|uniref:hypothetical protein n=1 Tax=Paenibacillus sp. SN-8-1 TaxID=3435409 RepID=UPI003D9A2020
MLALTQKGQRFTFPITPTEIQIQSGNQIDTFTVITGDERTGKLTSKAKRVSFLAIFPRAWEEIWENSGSIPSIAYQSPEQALKLLEKWKGDHVGVLFEDLIAKTMLLENIDGTYKDGQGNLHTNFTFVENKPVKIVSYSNTKQLLKPGVIITKASKSRPNTSSKTSKKNQKKKKTTKKKTTKKKANPNQKGAFDYTAQKSKIETKNRSVKIGVN